MSNIDEILKYKQLLDMGAITQEEFEKKKKELLGDIIETNTKKENISSNNAKVTNDKIEKKKKKTSLEDICLVIGILFFIAGTGSLAKGEWFVGIFTISIGLIISPIINNILETKVKWKLPIALRIGICVVLFIIYSINV